MAIFGVNPVTPTAKTAPVAAVGSGPQNFGSSGPSQLNGSAASMQEVKADTSQKVPFYDQPQFDPRIYTLPFLSTTDSSYFTRGYMKWDKANGLPGYSNKAAMHFLYNPTTISANYSVDSSDVTAALALRQPGDLAAPDYAMNQSVSFSLLFDRTFELWGSYAANGSSGSSASSGSFLNDPSQAGVGVDILAMKQLTGQLANQPAGTGNYGGVDLKNNTSYHVQQGPMVMVGTWLYFGAVTGGQFFYGFVDSWDYTITHWTQFMVPMRCTIDVDFTLLPPPSNESITGNQSDSDQWWALQSLQSAVYNGTNPATAGVTNTTTTAGKSGR